MSLSTDTPVHFIDFEGNSVCGIIEFGVVTVQKNKVSRTYSRLCRAQAPIASTDTHVHGIRYNDTQGHAPFSDEWEYFVSLRQFGILAAHYARFDNQLLKTVWSHPPFSPDFLNPGRSAAQWGPWIDTHKIYLKLFPRWDSHKLGALISRLGLQPALEDLALKHCGVQRQRFHCALYDALASAVLFMHIRHFADYANKDLRWFLLHGAVAPEQSLQGELFV